MTETTKPKRAAGNRLLGPGYAEALRVIANGPATWRDVMEQCGTNRANSQAVCHGFRRQRITHTARWAKIPGKGKQWTPVYELGEGADAPCPVNLRQSKAPTKYELLAFCGLVKALQFDSWHCKGVAEHLGQCERTVRRTLKAMHALRLIHIDDYIHRSCGGLGYGLYTWGPDLPDAKKPAPKTKRQVWTQNNAIASARRKHALLTHGMVRGVSLDGRRRKAANVEALEAAA